VTPPDLAVLLLVPCPDPVAWHRGRLHRVSSLTGRCRLASGARFWKKARPSSRPV